MANQPHPKPDTALQKDHAFVAVDDYDTRMYILPYLKEKVSRDAIIAEHRKAPRGAGTKPGEPAPLNSLPLKRLLDRLRVVAQAGKHTIVAGRDHCRASQGAARCGHEAGRTCTVEQPSSQAFIGPAARRSTSR